MRERLRQQLDRGLRRELEPLRHGDVIAGPFTGEVGFELLYWIPFLRWAAAELDLGGRLVVVSRGGTEHWLDGLDARYVDLLSLVGVDELRESREAEKQRHETPFERVVYERVTAELGLSSPRTLHPSLFFGLYQGLLKLDPRNFSRAVAPAADGATGAYAVYRKLQPLAPTAALAEALPEDYVAVRFYSRRSFPDTEENARFAAAVVGALARVTNVVLLDSGVRLDEHEDFGGSGDRVVSLQGLMRPETNLSTQTAAISGARAFVGTYGGLAYLAPFLGVPAVSFTTLPGEVLSWHYDLARRIFDGEPWAPLVELRPGDLPLLDGLLGGLDYAEAGLTPAPARS